MKKEVQIQIYELADALVRNINDNFVNVSFDILENGFIQVKIILQDRTHKEDEYIYDIAGEFAAAQQRNVVNKFEVTIDINSKPLSHIVYSKLNRKTIFYMGMN